MQTKNLIAVSVFCENHKIEISFITSLQQNGLIEIIVINNIDFLKANQMLQLEKIIRFYYDLNINLEGIETINHLLQRINAMQNEIIILKNKLDFFYTN